jgi:hypothetical protein
MAACLGQDGRHHEPLAVDAERPFDANQHVVGRADAHGAAPDDTSAFALDDAAHRRQVQVDGRERLHHIGRTGRRSDGARRGLGHHHAACRDDGHHQQRGAVARQSADAMLVQHGRGAPVEALSDVDHGARQRHGLVQVEPTAGADRHERGHVDVGKAPAADVFHERAQRGVVQPAAMHLVAQVRQRIEDRRVPHHQLFALGGAHQVPGRLRQRDLVAAQPVSAHLVQDREQMAPVGDHLHLRLRLEALGPTDIAIAAHVHHGLLVGVDTGAAGPQMIKWRHERSLLQEAWHGTRARSLTTVKPAPAALNRNQCGEPAAR